MEQKAIYRKAVKRFVFVCLLTTCALFGSAGTILWWRGWLFLAVNMTVVGLLTGVLFKKSPELLRERLTARKKAKPWDRLIVLFLAMVFPLIMIILAGLDRRYGWTTGVPTFLSEVALFVMIAANAFTAWAMKSNPFFSSHVRIQEDRGHIVVSQGPYKLVRHPGYSGMIIFNLAAPVLLGSFPALGIGLVICLLFVTRTFLEDRTLHKELAGYAAYARKTRFRLVPFVW